MATATGQGQARIGLARQKFAGFGTFKFFRLFIWRALGWRWSFRRQGRHALDLIFLIIATHYLLHYVEPDANTQIETAVARTSPATSPVFANGSALGLGPIRRCAVVIVNAFLIGAIAPCRRIGSSICGGALKLLKG